MSVLTKALDRIFHSLQQHRPEVASLLKPGLTLEEIESQVKNLPFRLPQEVFELYQWHNGIDFLSISRSNNLILDTRFIPYFDFLSLEQAIEESQEIEEFRYKYTSPNAENCHKPWFPIFAYDDLEYLIVFGDSTDNKISPVIHCHLGGGSLPQIKYPSLTTLMLIVAECYETGAYYMDENSEYASYYIACLEQDKKQVTQSESKYCFELLEEALEALRHPISLLNSKVFNTLMRLPDPRTLEPMLYALHIPLSEVEDEEKNIVIRLRAAMILGELGDLRAVEPLMRALEHRLSGDSRYAVANQAAEALGKLGDTRAIGALKQFLQNNRSILPVFVPSLSWCHRIALSEAREKANWALKQLERKNL